MVFHQYELLNAVLNSLFFILLYSIIAFMGFYKLRQKQTKISLFYFMTVSLTIVYQIGALGLAIIGHTINEITEAYVFFELMIIIGVSVIFYTLFVIANTFVFKWPSWTEQVFVIYYIVILGTAILGLVFGYGWVKDVNDYGFKTFGLDNTYSILAFFIPGILTILIGVTFLRMNRKMKEDVDKQEDKRAIQTLSFAYLLYFGPFLPTFIRLLFPTVYESFFTLIDVYSFVAINFFPIITYLLLYVGYYRPAWFTDRFLRPTWISTVLFES